MESTIVRKGRVITKAKAEHHVLVASTALLVILALFALFVVSIVQASPDPDSAAGNATFRTKCAMCHGQEGGGSEVGKSMNVPDLRSPAVQKLPNAELAQVILNGKGGMPAFKNSLSEDQIHSLLSYVRLLRQKKQLGKEQ